MEQDVRNLVQELEARWKSLTIANDFVFGKVMLDEDLCKDVLEAILATDIEKIEYVGRQDAIDVTEDGHGVRLDVYVRDDRGTVYSVEMQATNTHELPQRSRYYHAMLALSQIGDEVLDTEDRAVGVHLGIRPVAFDGEGAQVLDGDLQPVGGHLQEPAGGSCADPSHGEVVRDPVPDGDGLVVHSSDIDDGCLASLPVREPDGTLGVDRELFLDKFRAEVLSEGETSVSCGRSA